METRHLIDIYKDVDECKNFRLQVFLDPIRNYIQDHAVQFPWIYRARSSVIYLEEMDPEKRLRDAYMKGERTAKDTFLFHPYKKPFSSFVLRKFLLEDPYDPQRALVKYCRERPMKFVIFSKPGLNTDTVGIELAKYWKSVHVNPETAVNKLGPLEGHSEVENRLRNGSAVGINEIIFAVEEMFKSTEVKRRGFVLTGLPLRHHLDSEFHILQQMELIFETDNRPDIIIYITAPVKDIAGLNARGFVEDINTGGCLNSGHITDGEVLSVNDNDDLDRRKRPETEKSHDDYLFEEYNRYYEIEKNGFPIKIDKLPSYSEDLLTDYVNKILPIVDSYVLEYDSQCVIKVDGRLPISKTLDIIEAKLSKLPVLPLCEAKSLLYELAETKPHVEFYDDRSEDSLQEEKTVPEPEEGDDDDDEEEAGKPEEGEEEQEQVKAPEEDFGEEGTEVTTGDNDVQYYNTMVPEEALKRLKDFKKIQPDFKWNSSDFGHYCPVEYERGHICLGSPGHTCTYLGNLYMMSDDQTMREFLTDPDRFVVPPRPFPTCKIFMLGPPYSGKTTAVKVLSEYFNLRVISVKRLIEKITESKFSELQLRKLLEEEKKLRKVQNFEDEIFQSYERRRASDIIEWIKEVMPCIFQRIKFTSLIEIPLLEDPVREDEEKAGYEDEGGEETEDYKEEFFFPKCEGFYESVKRLSKPDLISIIAVKSFSIDFPGKRSYEKIYDNLTADPLPKLAKRIPFETASESLKILEKEFKEKGIDFYLDNEAYVEFFKNPILLLEYLPNQFRQPYYPEYRIDFHDTRVQEDRGDRIGVRTAFGHVSVDMEELVNALERKILDVEAEINMKRKNDDLQLGGWIVDDVPLNGPFWEILIQRYLLPDDIVIRAVNGDSCKKLLENFCAITGYNNFNLEENTPEDTTRHESLEFADDDDDNRFLEVKNSYLKINEHYKSELKDSETKEESLKKTCKDEKTTIISEELMKELNIKNEMELEIKAIKIFSSENTVKENATAFYRDAVKNPFDAETKPFRLNFWEDDLFLIEIFKEVTRAFTTEMVKDGSKKQSEKLQIIYTAEKSSVHEENESDSASEISLTEHSICSAEFSGTQIPVKPLVDTVTAEGYLSGKARASILKKVKPNKQERPIGKSCPVDLFTLHDKVILSAAESTEKSYDLFEIFYRDITSHISETPKRFDLKYLREVQELMRRGANPTEIAQAMAKYIRKKQELRDSIDNISLKSIPSDERREKSNRVKPGSKLMNILSDHGGRRHLQRVTSHLDLEQLKSRSSSITGMQKNQADISLSTMSLPLINESLGEEQSGILCYKESEDDIYKSSSVMLNVDSVATVHSDLYTHAKRDPSEIHLPSIQSSERQFPSLHSCYCMDPLNKQEICTCSSGSTTLSDISLKRKKKRLCIWDQSTTAVLPWIPSAVKERKQSERSLLRRVRERLAIKTGVPSELDILFPRAKATASMEKKFEPIEEEEQEESTEGHETVTDDYDYIEEKIIPDTESDRTEEQEKEAGNLLTAIEEEDIDGYRKNAGRADKGFAEGDTEEEDLNVSKKRTRKSKKATKATEKKQWVSKTSSKMVPDTTDSATDVLFPVYGDKSSTSFLYTVSSSELVKIYSAHSETLEKTDSTGSIEKFDSDYELPDRIKFLNNSDVLLPGVSAINWNRFKDFINGLYLSVTTLQEIGYNAETNDSFYLACCPSGSDLSVADNEPKLAVKKKTKKTKRKSNKDVENFIIKEFQQGEDGTGDWLDDSGEDDLCVLEVSLPMTASRFGIALDTALKCLTLGKTISEVYSANKHNYISRRRLSSTVLDDMYNDDTVKIIKKDSLHSGMDKASSQMTIDDASSNDAVFDEDGKLVRDTAIIELFDGNLLRYKSLDERYQVSVEMLPSPGSDTTEESQESPRCPDIFLSTIPRAVLYVPYVVPRFRPVRKRMRVTTTHLRRYYSLQTMCHLISEEYTEEQEEEEGEEEEARMLKFKYILKRPFPKSYKSILIKRDLPETKSIDASFEMEDIYGNREYGEMEEEMGEEGEFEEYDKDLQMLAQIQEIVEPLIEEFREELFMVEYNEIITAEETERCEEALTEDDRFDPSEREAIYDEYNPKEEGEETINEEVSHRTISDTIHRDAVCVEHDEEEMEEDEMELLIEKKLQFSFPYDIIKLIFEKYDYISIELPDEDIDLLLQKELSELQLPNRFDFFLKSINHNIKMWSNEWHVFNETVLKDIKCNITKIDFIPFYGDLHKHMSDGVLSLLSCYEPTAEYVDDNKEILIKTIDLEAATIHDNELEDIPEAGMTAAENEKNYDIGDTDLQELLPDGYSDFHPFCPVYYNTTHELIPAGEPFLVQYRDRYYTFSNQNAIDSFISAPQRYALLKTSDYKKKPIRICIVAPRDFEGIHIGRSVADCLGITLKTLSVEVKRLYGLTVDLPVGVFDEDPVNIKTFGLEEGNDNPTENALENKEWDRIRSYMNLITPLTDGESEKLIEPLWKAQYGFVLYSFPHSFQDLEYMRKTSKTPDAVIFLDFEQQRNLKSKEIEERITARQLLNFGARLKRLLTADAIRYRLWTEAYPRIFRNALRKFLRDRRAEHNFRQRLGLVLPTVIQDQDEEVEEENEGGASDVLQWNAVTRMEHNIRPSQEAKTDSTIPPGEQVKRRKKYPDILDDPKISPQEKNEFLEGIRKGEVIEEWILPPPPPQPVVSIDENTEQLNEYGEESSAEKTVTSSKELVNLSDIEFPDLKTIFQVDSPSEMSEEFLNEEYNDEITALLTKIENEMDSEGSDEQMNQGIKLLDRRGVANTDMFNPSFKKKYLPKNIQVIYKTRRPIDIDSYRKNVTDASSTSSLGLGVADSIDSKELTSSLSLLDVESTNREIKLLQLVLGNKVVLKGYFNEIVKKFKDNNPPPIITAKKLQKISLKNSKAQLKQYYKSEKQHVKQLKEFCQTEGIPYIVHNTLSPIKKLIQNVKNVLRKPNSFDKVYILNNRTAVKLLQNGYYFLSRFGHWCPVQVFERETPKQNHYTGKVKEKTIVPLLHKRYIYFLNGRTSAVKFMQDPVKYTEQTSMLTIFPVKVAIVGSHKSKKTLTAKNLATLHGLEYITAEIAIHYVIEKLHWTDAAKTILKQLRKGETVPQVCIIKCLEAFINGSLKSLTHGWVLDGYPIYIDDLQLMRETNIIPNVIFGIEPTEDCIQEIFTGLEKDRIESTQDAYRGNEFFDITHDEEEDEYYEMLHLLVTTAGTDFDPEAMENEDLLSEFQQPDEILQPTVEIEAGGEEEEEDINMKEYVHVEPPELAYVKRIAELLSTKHSSTVESVKFIDYDSKSIDFELNNMLPPIRIIENRMLHWLRTVKQYDDLLKKADETWNIVHKIEWNNDPLKLLKSLNEVLTIYIWALQDYNINIAKGNPAGLHLIGITEEEYRLHKSPFNDCCPVCWYYHRIYFHCPTCEFKDMIPGMMQYMNYFYWLCMQHYDLFTSNPVKFLLSYETSFMLNYPEKASIGESFIKDNLNVQCDGLCVTCYYNNLPELTHVKGFGKHSVIINKTKIYLFCSNKCLCEMLMRPARYVNLQIDYKEVNLLPPLKKTTERLPHKGYLEKIVSDAIYDAVCKFLYIRPKIYKLSHKTSACTYLALQLKQKAKDISKRERNYYKGLMDYMEDHCKEMEMFCRNIDQIHAFMGPLSMIEQAKARCLPADVQEELLKTILPTHTHS